MITVDVNKKNLETLREEILKNVIDEREGYATESMCERALDLDDLYLRVTAAISKLEKLIGKVREYLHSDIVRMERFSDIEICCSEDAAEAKEIIDEFLEKYTIDDCTSFLKAMENGADIVENGWKEN